MRVHGGACSPEHLPRTTVFIALLRAKKLAEGRGTSIQHSLLIGLFGPRSSRLYPCLHMYGRQASILCSAVDAGTAAIAGQRRSDAWNTRLGRGLPEWEGNGSSLRATYLRRCAARELAATAVRISSGASVPYHRQQRARASPAPTAQQLDVGSIRDDRRWIRLRPVPGARSALGAGVGAGASRQNRMELYQSTRTGSGAKNMRIAS